MNYRLNIGLIVNIKFHAIALCPEVKKQLWGGEFWTDGYFTSTVGKHGNENMIGKYVKNQGKEYKKLNENHQLAFF